MCRAIAISGLLSMALPLTALAQTAEDLKNDARTTGDVLTYGMGYNQQRFSPLTQINRETIK
jgi:alcohol dehydrogenase (cytochrome c)